MTPLSLPDSWPQTLLTPTDISVGPWAWDVSWLTDVKGSTLVRAHPSLVYVGPEVDEATLIKVRPAIADLPVLLVVREPEFARHLPQLIHRRMAALGMTQLAALALWVEDDPAQLKGGHALQTLTEARDGGLCRWIGLGHAELPALEWFAKHTPVRLLLAPWTTYPPDQVTAALALAHEYGMACLATPAAEADRAADRTLTHPPAGGPTVASANRLMPLPIRVFDNQSRVDLST